MSIEFIPVILGAVVCLIGLGLIIDAWTPDDIIVKRERRRRPRVERSRSGEASIGVGVIAMGAAFIGRDTWRYSVVAVIVGTLFLLIGAIGNRRYFAQAIANRGALRRRNRPS
jgi:hypothetical protein